MTSLLPVRVRPIIESTFGLDGGAMFGIIPRPLWERTNPPDEANRIRLAARCLFLEHDTRRVLIDTGMGEKWSPKERKIYALNSANEGIRGALLREGIDPSSITDIVLTHLHFDHAGGLTFHDETGALQATFPQATHWIQRENWVWAHHPSLRDAGSYRSENFAFLEGPNAPPLELVDGVAVLFDTLEVIPSRGHTPGMQMVRFVSEGQTVIYTGDLIPTLGHIQLPYVMGYDVYPLSTVREKRELLENVLRNDWVLAFEHDPLNGFARVERGRRGRYAIASSSPTLDGLIS